MAARVEKRRPLAPELAVVPTGGRGHAIVIGHGRVGQVVCDMLEEHHFPFLAVDGDPLAVSEFRWRGRAVYYGDATNPAFLESCGLADAVAAMVTIHTRAAIDEIVKLVRSRCPDITIVARARDADHASHLYEICVTDAVPETIEASLQLSEAALVSVGVPAGPVIASIHEKRDLCTTYEKKDTELTNFEDIAHGNWMPRVSRILVVAGAVRGCVVRWNLRSFRLLMLGRLQDVAVVATNEV